MSLLEVEEGLSHIRSGSDTLAQVWYQAEPNFESLETDLDSRAAKTGYESRMNVFWPCELLLATTYCYYAAKKTLEAACGRLHNGRNRYAAAGRVTAIGGSNWCYPAIDAVHPGSFCGTYNYRYSKWCYATLSRYLPSVPSSLIIYTALWIIEGWGKVMLCSFVVDLGLSWGIEWWLGQLMLCSSR